MSIALSTCALTAAALTPLTPRLATETHAQLLAGLTAVKLSDVAHNSVVLAITESLGFGAASGAISRPSDYPHLPIVKGKVTRVSESCSRVTARAWLPNESEHRAVVVEGTYCLTGPAEWAASRQHVSREH